MRLTEDTINSWLNDLTAKLSGGRLAFYGDNTPQSSTVSEFDELVSFRMPSPAFRPSVGGRATGYLPDKAVIGQSGTVTWARLSTPQATVDFRVATPNSAGANSADIIIERSDLQSGGKFALSSMVLTLPLTA